jgi:hypothetical protein
LFELLRPPIREASGMTPSGTLMRFRIVGEHVSPCREIANAFRYRRTLLTSDWHDHKLRTIYFAFLGYHPEPMTASLRPNVQVPISQGYNCVLS